MSIWSVGVDRKSQLSPTEDRSHTALQKNKKKNENDNLSLFPIFLGIIRRSTVQQRHALHTTGYTPVIP